MEIRKSFSWTDRELADPETVAQLRAAYGGLKCHVPLLYAVALANIVGLHVATGGQLTSITSPAPPLFLFILWRLYHWLRNRSFEPSARQIVLELRKIIFYAVALAGIFSGWAQFLLSTDQSSTNSVVFFGSLATVGCAYALSSYPPAASIPLVLLGVPIAIRLVLFGDTPQLGMGLSLLLVMLLIWQLLRAQNRTVTDLVSSRLGLKDEAQRAQAAEANSNRLATVDVLTNIANRRALLRALRAAETERGHATLALVDLDGFKPVNDAFGHHSGDLVLKKVARRLNERFADKALVARMGGDEFAILWRDQVGSDIAQLGRDICDLIQKPMVVERRPMRVFASCGIVDRLSGIWNRTDLLRQADLALYAAKARGRGHSICFSETQLKQEKRRAAIERALASGLAETEISVVFQPITDFAKQQIVAFEALARWENSELGPVEPSEFIPAAEQMHLIDRLTERTIEAALSCAIEWPHDMVLSFNVSAIQLCELGAAERLLSKMYQVGFEPARFQMEVTETALLADFSLARDNIRVLREAGSIIALDDFGAGHASISYLREMCFDVVKLDGSLISDLTHSVQARQLLHGIINLCRSLDVRCVAEHVETDAQFSILRTLGCDMAQGYLIGRPESYPLWSDQASRRDRG